MKGTWEKYDKNETLKKHVILLMKLLCFVLNFSCCSYVQPSNNNTLKLTSPIKKKKRLIKYKKYIKIYILEEEMINIA
jgi:hypothetical protein